MKNKAVRREWRTAFMFAMWAGAFVLIATTPVRPAPNKENAVVAQIERWIKPGRAAAEAGDFAKAIEQTNRSLDAARRQLGDEHWGVAVLTSDRGRWRFALGDGPGARTDAESALAMARNTSPSDATQIAYFSRDVGRFRFALGDCRGAREVLSAASDSLAHTRDPDLRAAILSDYVRVLWATGDVQGARKALAPLLIATAPDDLTLLAIQLEIDFGALPSARTRLDGMRIKRRWSLTPADWSSEYLNAELMYRLAASELAGARELADLAIERARVQGSPDAESSARHRLGQVLSAQGQFAPASRELQRAVELRSRPGSPDPPALSGVLHDLAWAYRLMGDLPRSEFYFERALAIATQCSSDGDLMRALMLRERALLRLDQGRVADALQDVDEAVRHLKDSSEDTRVLRGLLLATQAFAQERVGQLDNSQETMQQALTLIADAEGATSLNLPLGQVHLADLAFRRGRLSDASSLADDALTILEARGARSVWGTAAALSIRASAQGRAGDNTRFWRDADRFVEVTEQAAAPNGIGGTVSQSEILLARRQTERLLDSLPARSSDTARIAKLMQLPHISDATASLQASALETIDLPADIRKLVRQRSALLEQSLAIRSRLLLAQQRGDSPDREAVVRLDRTLAELSEVDTELVTRSPTVAGQFLQRGIDPSAVQRALRPSEAALLFVVSEERLHGLLVTEGAVLYRAAPMTRDEVRARVLQLRRGLDLALLESDPVPFDAASAFELFRATFGLFERELAGVRTLIVVPDDAMQSVPLSVFVPRLDSKGRAAEYLADRAAIVTFPSFQSFVALRSQPRPKETSRGYLAFADPDIGSFRAREGDDRTARESLDLVVKLDPLPDTRLEVQRMAKSLGHTGSKLFVGAEATESSLRTLDLTSFEVVSFATHGLMAGEVPGLSEPALVLTRLTSASGDSNDGLLTASEISRLKLKADLIILSACNTGRINIRSSFRGLSGLSRGFFAAGARSMIVSHWYVESGATAALLARTAEIMASDAAPGPAEALRQAMVWMRRGGASANYTEPGYWAAFAVVGESTPRRAGATQ